MQGTIGSVTVDNVRVPQGAACTLDGARIQGTVKAERDATLPASGVRVDGNVQGEGARRVELLAGSQVGGSVRVVRGGEARVDAHGSPAPSCSTPTAAAWSPIAAPSTVTCRRSTTSAA